MTKGLRKYRNENTTSSMVPPFLKDLGKKADKEMKAAKDEDVPKQNAQERKAKQTK